MARILCTSLLLVVNVFVSASLRAAEKPVTSASPEKPALLPPHEVVCWKLERNVKEAIQREVDEFGKNLKAKLGAKRLSHKPFVAVDESPEAASVAATTIGQIVDRALLGLAKQADCDNEELLPLLYACRRSPISRGSDLLTAPKVGEIGSGQRTGTVTFKVQWENVGGRFKNDWDENDVDELYELQLNATLTLGISLTLESEEKLTVIDYTVVKPLVTGWRVTLVASEGESAAFAVRPALERGR